MRLLIGLIVVWMVAGPVEVRGQSAEDAPSAPPPAAETTEAVPPLEFNVPELPGFGSILIKTFGAVALIGLLIVGVVAVLRRTLHPRNGGRLGSQTVRVLTTSFLGPKKSICLVDVAGHILVLGVTEHTINMLSELDAADLPALPEAAPARVLAPFAQVLNRLARGHKA